MSAASSSGACVHAGRATAASHRLLQRRVRIQLEQVERQVIGRAASIADRPCAATRPATGPGSQNIRSRLTLVEPGGLRATRRASRARAPNARGRAAPTRRRRTTGRRSSCAMTPAARNASSRSGGGGFRIGLERDLGRRRDGECRRGRRRSAARPRRARAATACRRRRRSYRPAAGRRATARRAARRRRPDLLRSRAST